MMKIISDYFINVTLIPGGVRINLGYAMVVIFMWASWVLIKRARRRLS
ncbi:MAG: hypothetical protein G01um1014107_3 [Parcubacteria group bacterium Gr01-1014_107]|nr:MAG: hypothetical protein G01um1014107_3 [Parcubacteria group bacterium Gr01-1014_107]